MLPGRVRHDRLEVSCCIWLVGFEKFWRMVREGVGGWREGSWIEAVPSWLEPNRQTKHKRTAEHLEKPKQIAA